MTTQDAGQEWLHERSLVYRLTEGAPYRGKRAMVNAITLHAERGCGTTDADTEALAARVHRLLVEDDARMAAGSTKCHQCRGTGYAAGGGHYEATCPACGGTGDPRKRAREAVCDALRTLSMPAGDLPRDGDRRYVSVDDAVLSVDVVATPDLAEITRQRDAVVAALACSRRDIQSLHSILTGHCELSGEDLDADDAAVVAQILDTASQTATHRHYKGGLYQELHRGTDEATMSPIVVYQAISDGRVWVRSADEFDGSVSEGKRRFEPIAAAKQGDHQP